MKVTLTLLSADETERIALPDWPAEPSDTPGLVVCKMPLVSPAHKGYLADDGTWMIPQRQELYPGRCYYQIIHINSGIAVSCYLLNKTWAFTLANRLSEMDWTVSKEEINRNPDYGKLVRSARDGETDGQ